MDIYYKNTLTTNRHAPLILIKESSFIGFNGTSIITHNTSVYVHLVQ